MSRDNQQQIIPLTNFEKIKSNIINNNTSTNPMKNNIEENTEGSIDVRFFDLLKENDELNIFADSLISDIDSIGKETSSIPKNITFKSIISSLRITVKEYKYQKILFERYVKSYSEVYNEENVVKILDLIRQIISDRRVILNDITNNLLKLQKLDNDRMRIDLSSNEDDDVEIDDLLSPDEF